MKEKKERPAKGTNAGGWLRVIKGNRALTVVGGVALLSLGFGLGASNLFVNEAGAAVEAPEPGLITVPVELGHLSNDVTIRADIGFADASDITLNTASVQGPAIVTGAIPEAGYELNPLSIALEITGRPVIVLPGELPAYRTLSVGMSGPDVVQFKEAMRAIGINAGDPSNPVFDATAANAVRALYERVGYTVPSASENASEMLRLAEETVRAAERRVEEAQSRSMLRSACATPWVWNWDMRTCDVAPEFADTELPRDIFEAIVAAGRNQDRETTEADNALTQARASLTEAQQGALPQLPVSEILFLNNLPRRVDSVSVTRGATLTGVSMRVSGAVLQLRGSATEANARLLEVGGEAFFDLPGGGSHRAVIKEISAPTDGGSRWNIEFTPDPLTPEQFATLQGSNVRIQIPVGATQGDVLFVPVSALTAGPGGEARLEVVESDPRDGATALTRLVVVDTGLAANGFVEVTPVSDSLSEGDLVVVGR